LYFDVSFVSSRHIQTCSPVEKEEALTNCVTALRFAEPRIYLQPTLEGEPGYLVTRGGHVMAGYVGSTPEEREALNRRVFHVGGWYSGLGDVGFWLSPVTVHDATTEKDLYW